MANGHEHHHHDHAAITDLKNVSLAFYIGIGFNLLFVIIEVIAGFIIHSLSLLSDAGHNLTDVVGLALSLLAFRLAQLKPTETFTYGYRRTTILAALFNSILLLVSIGAIGYEAIKHLLKPEELAGSTIAWVAGIGIFVNGITAFMFLKNKKQDINIKSAYLHLLSDALISLALVAGGIIIHFTHWFWIDPLLSLLIATVIIKSTWTLFAGSIRLSLDAVPENVDIKKIETTVSLMQGVENMHHIHAWALSTNMNALTAHILVTKDFSMQEIDSLKKRIKHELEHLNIQHATLEFEQEMQSCKNEKL